MRNQSLKVKFLVGVLVCLSVQASHAQLPPGTWQYHWGDEFNESTLDTMKWSYNYPWGSTHNHDAFMSPNNVILGDGTLTLRATRQSQGGKPFTSGAISSGYSKFTVSGGYIEARIRLPDTPGSWPAFWGLYDGWPPEADIMEYPIDTAAGNGYAQDQYHTAFHYRNSSGGNSAGAGQVNPSGVGDLGGTYHNFGMEWRANDWVGFYFNGQLVSQFGDDAAIAQMQSMYLILNYAVGGWPGLPNTSEWPVNHSDEMKVDWVRVWKQASSKTTNWAYAGSSEEVSWNTGSNWSNGSPNLAGITANFNTVSPAEQRITWSGIRAITALNFDGSTTYRIGSAGNRLLMAGADNLSGKTSITVASTSTASLHEIRADLELRSDITIANYSEHPLQITGQFLGQREITIDGTGEVVFPNVKSYRGNTIIKNGKLVLSGLGTIPFTPLIDVRPGGTLDASGLNGVLLISNGRTLNNDSNATVIGNVVGHTGSLISGSGTFDGNLTAQAGSTIRVGPAGLGAANRFVIDDFEGYNLGDVRDVASPPWTAHQNTGFVDIENVSGNKALSFGWASDFRGASRLLTGDAAIENDQTATLFFRVNSITDAPNHNVGLGDIANTGAANFGDFETQLRLKADVAAGTFSIDARDSGAFSSTLANGLALNSWYNFWMVVDQTTDTYDIYMNTGLADATDANKLNGIPLAFRNGTSDSLNRFLALAGPAPVDNGVRIDDLVYLSGLDLTNPLAGFDPGISAASMTMTVTGNLTLNVGSTLAIDIHSPGILDLLDVSGHFSAAGALEVSLVAGAPELQLGERFKVLEFGSSSGSFNSFNLPNLEPGLAWNVTNLLATGELEVVVNVDLDGDGDVDGRDFLLIQRLDPSLTTAWQELYGSTLVTSASAFATSIPEPTSWLTTFFFTSAALLRRGRCGANARS